MQIGGDKVEMTDVIFGFVIGAIISAVITFLIIISLNSVYIIEDGRTIISYEYIAECRCGGTIEGYQSLVDDYNREECDKCGYHKE